MAREHQQKKGEGVRGREMGWEGGVEGLQADYRINRFTCGNLAAEERHKINEIRTHAIKVDDCTIASYLVG